MIEKEKVFAEINQQDGMVKFKSNPNQFDTTKTLEYFDKYFRSLFCLLTTIFKLSDFPSLPERGCYSTF